MAVIFACLSPLVEDVKEGLMVLATAACRIAKPLPLPVVSTPSRPSRSQLLEEWMLAKGKTPRGSAVKGTPSKSQSAVQQTGEGSA